MKVWNVCLCVLCVCVCILYVCLCGWEVVLSDPSQLEPVGLVVMVIVLLAVSCVAVM